jgi:hypothetical protein
MRTTPLVALALALVFSAGCGSKQKLYPVTGKVTFQNKPATGALVVFHPKGDNSPQAIRPSGLVKEDGTYALSSGPGEDGRGAPAGEYEIAVIWDVPAKAGFGAGMGGDERREEKDLLGGRYKTPATSGLKATVNAGPTEVPAFELK